MQAFSHIGFIGLGVMGEPMCRNLTEKSGLPLTAFDTNPAPLARLVERGARAATDIAAVMDVADVVFLSLPSGEIVHALAHAPDGLLARSRTGQIVIDTSTSPVDSTRALHAAFAERGVVFVDAPIARTRAAAEAGTLSVMVGGEADVFARIRSLIATYATDIALCGPVGSGQVVKILNNMVLFETVTAFSEAHAIAQKAGVDPKVLFDCFTAGSADSFALRNHGMKAVLPGNFPEKAFPVSYAAKDLRYALELAEQTGVRASGAANVKTWFDEAEAAGYSEQYFPVISTLMTGK